MSGDLVIYDAMCRAIAEAHSIDEVKAIRNRAVALEYYARQAQNEQMEIWCREIRERAEVRWGDLRRDSGNASGRRTDLADNLPRYLLLLLTNCPYNAA